jgi:GT2 family glycosyltransferase
VNTTALTIIVCTRNRARALEEALARWESLPAQPGVQLVFVDNGSSDDTRTVLDSFASRSAHRVTVLQEARPGLSRARNRGLGTAEGDIVAFTDDDCYPAEDYVEALLACFSVADVTFAGGRVMLHDPEDLAITIQERDEPLALAAGEFVKPGLIHGANMAFRRSALLRIDGFDERLGAGAPFKAGEDTDAILRCTAMGYVGCYDPAIVVSHHHGRRTAGEAEALKAAYAAGRGACMAKLAWYPPTRGQYARKWYWSLRLKPWSARLTELGWGLRFVMRGGVLPRRVYAHPHDSLVPGAASA